MDKLPYNKGELAYFFTLKQAIPWDQSTKSLEAIYNSLQLEHISPAYTEEFGTRTDDNSLELADFFDKNEPFAKACLEKTLDDDLFEIQFSENKGNDQFNYYLARYTVDKTDEDKILSFSAIITPISIDQYYERKLRNLSEELNRRIQELHNINFTTSHRIRSPLARILGLIELLKLEGKYDPYVEMLETSSKELDKEIRRFTKILDEDRTLNQEKESGSKEF